MGAAARFVALVAAPLPPLRPSLILFHRRLSALYNSPLRLHAASSSSYQPGARASRFVKCFHSQSSNNSHSLPSSAAAQDHPWPEWTNFLNVVSIGQGFASAQDYGIPPEDAFVAYEKLPDDFVRAAASCIAFSHARPDLLRMLSRRDIEEIVSNGTPFLFKSALETSRRMRAFLGTDGSNAAGSVAASTVDLMKYILSYASNPTVSSGRNGLFSREAVDFSVRNLLHELANIRSGAPYGNFQAPGENQYGPHIQMKRGDWICTKCNFMNFARNMKCLECEESRPKRSVVGSEWDCPQCHFFNYGRNTVCLRCDHRRPGAPLSSTTLSQNGSSDQEMEQGDKTEGWFKKITELHNASDLPNAASDDSFSEMMPARKGENLFVLSKHKDRSLTSPKYKRQAALDQANNGAKFVPFVPFPPGYFASKNPSSTTEDPKIAGVSDNSGTETEPVARTDSEELPFENQSVTSTSSVSETTGLPKSEIFHGGWVGPSLEGSAVKEADPLDMSEEAKAEMWFKRVAQIKDISELSQIPDEDFPSIMPMRKGVNRFVVSKRKTPLERRLASQQYRRNLPVVTSTNFLKKVDEDS